MFMSKLPTCLYKKFKSKQSTGDIVYNKVK
jgi:hypothetical protein